MLPLLGDAARQDSRYSGFYTDGITKKKKTRIEQKENSNERGRRTVGPLMSAYYVVSVCDEVIHVSLDLKGSARWSGTRPIELGPVLLVPLDADCQRCAGLACPLATSCCHRTCRWSVQHVCRRRTTEQGSIRRAPNHHPPFVLSRATMAASTAFYDVARCSTFLPDLMAE